MEKVVIYPGSFDPFTKGHESVVTKALKFVDKVVIAVVQNENKRNQMFTSEERANLIKEIYKDNDRVKTVIGVGATVRVAEKYNCIGIARGLRGASDLEQEITLARMNEMISKGKMNTIFFLADNEYSFCSSSGVKALYNIGEDYSKFVDPIVKKAMIKKN